MCRILGYLGPPLAIEDLMTKPANSLVNQSFDAKYHHLLQLGGSGFASWEQGSFHEERPIVYKSAKPAFFDRGLRTISENTRTTSLLAHIRATEYSEHASINDDNCHPFLYPDFRLALAHNGGLPGWRPMLHDIVTACRPDVVANLSGTTDTEFMYCLLMSQFSDPTANLAADEIVDGLQRFMREIIRIKKRHGNELIAKLKLFLADGDDLIVANLGLGEGFATTIDGMWEDLRTFPVGTPGFAYAGVIEPAWYMAGDNFADHEGTYDMTVRDINGASTVIVGSEPLTKNASNWERIPFQHVAMFSRAGGVLSGSVEPLDF